MRLTSTLYILCFYLESILPSKALLNPGTIIPYLPLIISLLTSYLYVGVIIVLRNRLTVTICIQ